MPPIKDRVPVEVFIDISALKTDVGNIKNDVKQIKDNLNAREEKLDRKFDDLVSEVQKYSGLSNAVLDIVRRLNDQDHELKEIRKEKEDLKDELNAKINSLNYTKARILGMAVGVQAILSILVQAILPAVMELIKR